MKERKQSFLERLTGTQVIHNDLIQYEETPQGELSHWPENTEENEIHQEEIEGNEETSSDADPIPGLPIDMHETDNELIIQTMIAGVVTENLHITITRNIITISGARVPHQGIPDDSYIQRELYWGAFSQEISLPYEIDTDGAEAVEKYGLLIIRLPRIDKNRPQILKVTSI